MQRVKIRTIGNSLGLILHGETLARQRLADDVLLALNGPSLTTPDAERLSRTLALAAGEIGESDYAARLRASSEEA